MTVSQTGKIVLYIVVLMLVAALAVWLGTQLAGNEAAWRRWLYQARFCLLFWRLALYLSLAAFWLSLRKMQRQHSPAHNPPPLRTAILFFLLIACAEYSNLAAFRGGNA